jgi:hypothetical protein
MHVPEKPEVYIEDIADKLEETMEYWEQYLNIATGEFTALSDGTYIETDEELAEKIDNSSDFVRLPNQYDIHEYDIMENFADIIENAQKRERLFRALNGKKPFRHFKDTLDYTGLTEKYYSFRALAYLEIAKAWCDKNGIPYKNHKQEGA